MSFSLLHKLVAYLVSGLGLAALALGSQLNEVALALIFIGYVASIFAEGPMLRRPIYVRGWTGAVVAFLVVQALRAASEGPTLAMAIEFAAVLQISRLWNRREATDYQQIAVLAFLHLIAATVLSTDLTYALIFIGFVIATPWMLALSHLRREIEGNYPASTEGNVQGQAAIRRVLASRRVVGPGFLVGTAMLSLPLFAMTLTIFIAIPRVGKGFLSFNQNEGQRVAGFGNQVELGGFGVIRDDPTVVLRVTPLPAVEQKAPRLQLRLRGTSFDHYDGRRWTRSPSTARSLNKPYSHRLGSHRYTLLRPPAAGDRQYQIVLEQIDEPVLFLPLGTVAIDIPPRVVSGAAHVRPLTRSLGLDVRYVDPDGLGLIYVAHVGAQATDGDLPALSDEPLQEYLAVPPEHGRVAELARRVVGDAQTDLEAARRVERFLKNGAYRYTLVQPDVGNRIPLDVFLFEAKRGHCEYYSTAMAIMLRTLGVPTRNVTGFVGGRFNPFGKYYALRQGDAHSWVEVLIRGRGWVTFDPTPTAAAALGPAQNMWSDVNAFIDALRMRWMTTVVGYDLETQRGMVIKLYRWFKARQAESDRTGDALGGDSGRWSNVSGWGRWLVYLLLAGTAVFAYFRFRMRPTDARGRPMPEHVVEAVGLYLSLERALERRGLPRPKSRTPLEHARALSELGFSESDDVRDVTESYLAVRYGEQALAPEELVALRAKVKRVSSGSTASSSRA